MEFKKTTLKFKFDGVDCEVKYPSAQMSAELGEILQDESVKLSERIKKVCSWLCELGLDKDIAGQLEMSHLSDIAMSFAEKKS